MSWFLLGCAIPQHISKCTLECVLVALPGRTLFSNALILSGKQSHWNQENGMHCLVRIVRGGTKKKAGRYSTCWIGQLPFLVTWSVVKYKDINQQISFTAKDGLYDQLPSFHFCCMTPATFKQLMVQVFPCRNHPLVNGKSPWETTSRTEASWKEMLTV